ncbi:MAG: ATP-binding protein [Clostridia bacterium]|nr:ATP-binding protein [Clostridia bacterium]
MIANKHILNEVELAFTTEQNQREFELDLLEQRLLQNEDYSIAVNQIATLEFDLQKALFSGNEALAEKIEQEIKHYKSLKEKLRIKLGFDDTQITPPCPICGGTGHNENGYCKCFVKRATALSYKELSTDIPTLSRFSDDTLSHVNGTKIYFEKLHKYADNLNENSKNIIITGKTGTGKTFLAQAVSQSMEDKKVVLFLNANRLNNIFIEMMYLSPQQQNNILNILYTCDFLVIDDLGAERILNNVTAQNLYTIISERQERKKPYMITTNLSLDEIGAKYGDRLFSRLSSRLNLVLELKGSDLRKS